MKKIFIYSLATFLFIVGITILPTHKSEAAVTASISASSTSVKVGDSPVNISARSNGADFCTITLNGSVISTSTSGDFSLSTSIPGTYTYRIDCKHLVVVPATTQCYIGFWQNPDPVHPGGGTVTYTGSDNGSYTESGIWDDRYAQITYKTGTSPYAQGAHSTSCPTGSWSYASACPTYCGYSGGTQTQTCTGGNSLCDGPASSRSCSATAACPSTSSCKGTVVRASVDCDGAAGPGPDDGLSCSSFTTKEACNPSSCDPYFHHGCSWN